MNVYVVLIEGRNFDTVPTVFRTEQEAFASIVEWVNTQWKQEMGGKRRPTDAKKRVDAYFDAMWGDESYSIHICTLEEN